MTFIEFPVQLGQSDSDTQSSGIPEDPDSMALELGIQSIRIKCLECLCIENLMTKHKISYFKAKGLKRLCLPLVSARKLGEGQLASCH